METVIILQANIEPFKSIWGAWAIAQPFENKFYLPLGWEEELEQRNIKFTIEEINIIDVNLEEEIN
jgi:hypothetical protein